MCGLILKGKYCIPFVENIIVVDLEGISHGNGTLTIFTNEKGRSIDDSIVTEVKDDHIYIVVNAGCRDKDFKACGGDDDWKIHDDRSLFISTWSSCFPML